MFKEVCDLLNIIMTRITPYRPSVNGQVERMNRTILQILRCFIRGHQDDWDLHLATVGMAIGQLLIAKLVLHPIFLSSGERCYSLMTSCCIQKGNKTQDLLGHMRRAIRAPWVWLIERPGRNYSNLNDAKRGIIICTWKKENTLYLMRFIDLTDLLCWDKVITVIIAHLVGSRDCDTSDFISIVSYC